MQIKNFFKKTIVLALSFVLSVSYIFAQDFDYEAFLKSIQEVSETQEATEEDDDFVEVIPADVPEVDPADVSEVDPADVPEVDPFAVVEDTGDDDSDNDDETVGTDISEVVDVSDVEEETEQTEEKHEYQALALIRYKNTDTISFKLKVSYIPKPYILGISLAAGYTEYKLIQPFYFGGYIEPHVGIPQKAFPYKYELAGKAINGPLIVGGKLYAPFGICVFPFQQNIEFFVEVAPGITLDMMWNAKMGKDSITSKLYPAFYGMLRTGATFKGFTFFVEGNYDAILGFGVSAGIGYSLNFDLNPRQDYAPSLE